MKIGFSSGLALCIAAAVLQTTHAADEKASALKDQRAKVSYGIGMNIGNNLKRSGYDVDVNILAEAIKDVMAGGELKLTEADAREALNAYQKELNTKREEERIKTAEKNKKEGEVFLRENAKKEGVVVTKSGLQYKVIAAGKAAQKPALEDVVTVNYRGTFINGTEFDSTQKRKQPYTAAVSALMKGWIEALQLMSKGSKWELYIPAELAYGEEGSDPHVGPNAVLIFEVELLEIEQPKKP